MGFPTLKTHKMMVLKKNQYKTSEIKKNENFDLNFMREGVVGGQLKIDQWFS